MDTMVDLSCIEDNFVIHYGGRLNEVKANTFANSLIYLSNVLDEINQEVNPNFTIEVIIEAIGPGSFRPKIKLTAKKIKDLFGGYVKKDQIIMILIALLALKQSGGIENNQYIKVEGEQVIITEKTKKIVLPKTVYKHTENIYNNTKIQRNIQNHFHLLEDDTSITDFGIVESPEKKQYLFQVERDDFPKLSEDTIKIEDETHKIQKERATLQVIRSILEKKKRRWEFIWKGFRIPAIIECEEFYQKLENGMKFGLGDSIEVTLEIHQVLDNNTNVWENESYVITEFHDYKPAPVQTKIENPT